MMSALFDDDAEMDEEFVSTAFHVDDVRAMEQPLLNDGVPLMRMAASATAMTARVMMVRAHIPPDQARIVLLAGGGDNGGDGLFAAAELAQQGAQAVAIAVGRTLHTEGLAAFEETGGQVIVLDPRAQIDGHASPSNEAEADGLFEDALDLVEDAHLVIDAMTGIGLSGALRGIPAQLAAEIGNADGVLPKLMAMPAKESLGDFPMVLAVDTPSGIGVDDGTLPGPYIPANVTITFGAMKPCAMLPPACHACGDLVLVDFQFDTSRFSPAVESMTMRTAAQTIRLPQVTDSKYSRGVVGLITGSTRYPGAAMLSSHAAAVSNAGMIRYCGPTRAEDLVLREIPEAVMGTGHVQAWVVGSGVPSGAADENGSDPQRQEIQRLLAQYDAEDEQSANIPPIVVDAGAIDLLPETCSSQVLITPHAGELARLICERDEDITADDVMAEPLRWAMKAWELTGANVLLKGAVTVIVGYDTDGGPAVMTSGSAPAWLATAGAGDVLAGIQGSVLAQSAAMLRRFPDQIGVHAAVGAYVHGMAAQLASESVQRGWNQPVVYTPEDPIGFLHAMTPGAHSLPTAAQSFVGTLGHPITAQNVIEYIPDAFAALIALYDDPHPDEDDMADIDDDDLDDDNPNGVNLDDDLSDDVLAYTSDDDDSDIDHDDSLDTDDEDTDDDVYLDANREYTDAELDTIADRILRGQRQ